MGQGHKHHINEILQWIVAQQQDQADHDQKVQKREAKKTPQDACHQLLPVYCFFVTLLKNALIFKANSPLLRVGWLVLGRMATESLALAVVKSYVQPSKKHP
jgi:hypothetical protein